MKGAALGLVLVAFLAITVSLLLAEGAAGGEIASFNEWPKEDRLVIYEGQDCTMEIELRVPYLEWNLFMSGPLVDGEDWMDNTEDVTGNVSGKMFFKLPKGLDSVEPGEYEVLLRIERTYRNGTTETENISIPVTYMRAIQVEDFELVRGASGLTIRLEVTTYVHIDALEVNMYVWDSYDTLPGRFEVSDVEPGTHVYASDVEPTMATIQSPTLMGYGLWVWIDDTHYIELEEEIEDPEVTESGRDYMLLFAPLLVAFLVIGGVIVLFQRHRGRGKGGADGMPPQQGETA